MKTDVMWSSKKMEWATPQEFFDKLNDEFRAFYDGKEWGDGLMKIRGITHWMPLPMPPKGDEGK